MYGKLFEQMYNGTLGTKGPWQALVTFQQMIILADQDGIVDMTPEVISKRSTIPLEIIAEGIKCLELPDPDSRTPDEEGRRITRLDPDRSWGWRIVNHAHYRKIRNEEERREYMRIYQQKRRAEVKNVNIVSTPVNEVTHAVSSKQNAEASKALSRSPTANGDDAVEVLKFLNVKTGKQFRMVDTNLKLIRDRLKSGATVQDCKTLIARKCNDWARKPEMQAYLRPATLFNLTKFEQYIGEIEQEKSCNAPVATRESSPDRNHAPVGGARQTQTSEKPPQTQTVKDALALALGADANGPEFLPAK